MLNFFIPSYLKLGLAVLNGLIMWAYVQIDKVIAPMIVLETNPELFEFTATELAPGMAETFSSMPDFEKIEKMQQYMNITTIILSVVMAYLVACFVARFLELKQSNKSLKDRDALKRAP